MAQQLLEEFVKTFAEIFGEHLVSFNIHGLLHLAECVKLYGPLDDFSAYKFENYMQYLKKIIRKPNGTLQQIFNRTQEINSLTNNYFYKPKESFKLNVFENKDAYCHVRNKGSFKVTAVDIRNGKKLFYGFKIQEMTNFFEQPLSSMDVLGISLCSGQEEHLSTFYEEEIAFKYFTIPCNNVFIMIPVMHTIFHNFSFTIE